VGDYTAELEYIENLSPLERRLYFRNQVVQMETYWLKFMVENRKEMGYKISDIRKQRERVQWAKKKLNQATKQLIGQKQYFGHSAT
jgi:hypothetical protein